MEEFFVVSSQKCHWPKFWVSLCFHTKELPHFVSFSTLNEPETICSLGEPDLSLGEKYVKLKCNYSISLGKRDFSLGEMVLIDNLEVFSNLPFSYTMTQVNKNIPN